MAVTDGPCHIVRHPGYRGMIISYLGSLLLLDAPCKPCLPGYTDYARRTRFRLLPGLW